MCDHSACDTPPMRRRMVPGDIYYFVCCNLRYLQQLRETPGWRTDGVTTPPFRRSGSDGIDYMAKLQ